ncbi:M24 family metallopeptidase [Peristeroidobacter soli]|uniref:M24 family metallopeptidase n=1 Tax=Peristeroidobacter soli TaxID=2497877 RepID=UPI00101DF750|nr:M24 family metallopeptidase [Peristeroidobacter soli]
MTNLAQLQARLAASHYDAVLVPSSDEFLSEYSQPHDRRLAWATGFTGSTGSVIVARNGAGLFVDGRYTEQALQQVDAKVVEVCPATDAARLGWLRRALPAGATLTVDPRLHSEPELQRLIDDATRAGFDVQLDPHNLIDDLWTTSRPAASRASIFDYPVRFAGLAREAKIAQVRARMTERNQDLLVVCDPEDVAWLLNVRTRDSVEALPQRRHIVPIPRSRVLVPREGAVLWFVDDTRLEPSLAALMGDLIQLRAPQAFEDSLRQAAAQRVVAANVRKMSHWHAQIVRRVGRLLHDIALTHARWVKHPNEIAVAREGHLIDGAAVVRFLAWLLQAVKERTVTEMEADEKVTALRERSADYLGLSMNNHSASGPSAALPHYVATPASNRVINDHPVFWMDTGGQYAGCSTDNTICFAVGVPEARHVEAHTLVVKGWIAMARAQFPDGIHSTQLDTFARQFLWSQGKDYGHGTGHGVGNFMNIHEGPYIRKEIDHPLVAPMAAGMIVSNEPGCYVPGDFGVRVESHLLTVPSSHPGFLKFETLSKLPIDPRLIDATLLDRGEIAWLADYHEELVASYRERIEPPVLAWLRGIAEAFSALRERGVMQ